MEETKQEKTNGIMKNVLIVEDDPLHLKKIKSAFRGYENKYRIQTANTLNAAIHLIQHEKPDLILTDNYLPDGEGREIMKKTKGGCPIILMTAYGNENIAVQAMKEGIQDYIVKLPESIPQIPGTIERSLREWKLMREREMLKGKYQKLVENALAGIGISDLNENLIFTNDTFANMLDYTKEELEGVNLSKLVSENTFEKIKDETRKRLKKENSVYEITLLKKDGSPAHLWVHGSPYQDETGNIAGTIGVLIDVTERLKAEQAIKQSEIFNRAIISNTGEGIAVYDKELRYKVWNPFMEKITGKKESELLGKCAPDIFPHIKKNGLDQLMKRALNGEQVRTDDIPFEVPLTGKSGWISGLYSPHYDEKGNIIGIIANIHDITERKKNEEKLHELNATKDRLISIIGHDLRNPISEIMGFIELLLQNGSSYSKEKMHQFHQYIHHSTKALHDLLENLLEWSHLQRGQKTFQPEQIGLKKVIENIMPIFKAKAEQNKVRIKNNISDSTMVRADRQMIHTVIRNLLSNALKYTPKKGEITIHAHAYGEKILVEVSDNGIGMSLAQQKKLFRFEEGPSRKGISGEKGTGIGLNICKELIEKSGEKIWVESEPGKGTSFYFTVPLAET